ncbi:E3 ubiquitin-protein ligase TRIM39-like isoform X2 [Gadus chalcogrammus]|uniref:E3 ubiquitin-protein ligase TRIM39-like isoform X2 n=1 Tax=Gadus chalcogrammus TaxID=1042646 RepID=UPI0024C49EDF|nr:E3 ubiquitin-protein ligase TRIM39-like isoform X2 [Gadus chalcogrammus]
MRRLFSASGGKENTSLNDKSDGQKPEQGMASAFPPCSEENLSCPICLEVLNCPVSTPCGHNFCRACIETSWRGKFSYTCPLCNKVFQKIPDLRVNYLVTDLADQFRSNLQVNEQHCAKPEDWTTVEVCPQPDVRTVSRAQDQLEETLNVRTENPRDLKAALEKYACELTLDPNTAHRDLSLSEDNRKVTWTGIYQSHPDHPERFDSWPQVLCREALTGHCYWEVEWGGVVDIGVTYRGISRRGEGFDSELGWNDNSWSLCCGNRYTAWYKGMVTDSVIQLSPAGSKKVGLYLDWPAGSLSFYRVSPGGGGSSDTLTHIHTFQSTFTQDLYPLFLFNNNASSVSLCRL